MSLSSTEEGINTQSPAEKLFRSRFKISDNHTLPKDTLQALGKLDCVRRMDDDITVRPVTNTQIINSERIEKWKKQFLELFHNTEQAERIANKLLGNLRKVGQDEFEDCLVQSFLEAKNHLSVEDLDSARFIYYSGGIKRSDEWVKNLCRDHFPSDDLLSIPTIDYYDKTISGDYKTGIIIDDAAYTGTNVGDHIKIGNERFGMKKFIVAIPYMTDEAVKQVQESAKTNGLEVIILRGKKLETVKEVLDEQDYDFLKRNSPAYRIEPGQTLTYFSHKVPDYRSFCPYIGYTRHVQVEDHLSSLIVQSPAVYHKEYFSSLQEKN